MEDMFVPNRGKKFMDKKTIELGDDFFPNRGRRNNRGQQSSKFKADSVDFFYPNRGKRILFHQPRQDESLKP